MEPIDIWRVAALLLAQEGKRASKHAARRISELTEQGDIAGAALWANILAAVASLRSRDGEFKARRFSARPRPAVLPFRSRR
jgi:hypothetical protein